MYTQSYACFNTAAAQLSVRPLVRQGHSTSVASPVLRVVVFASSFHLASSQVLTSTHVLLQAHAITWLHTHNEHYS